MLGHIPREVLIALSFPGMLAIALALCAANDRARGRRINGRSMAHAANFAARLAGRLANTLAAVAAAITRDAPAAHPIAVEVLVEDRALRDRAKRRVRDTLARCAAAIGTPPARCAVLVARTLERDGRRIGGCVERLAHPDGTTRTVIWLALEDGPVAPSLDAVAARLASYYAVATGAERTTLLVDMPPERIPPPLAAVPRAANPEPPALAPQPSATGARRA